MPVGVTRTPLPGTCGAPCLGPRSPSPCGWGRGGRPSRLRARCDLASRLLRGLPGGPGRGVRVTMLAGEKRRIIVVLRWVMAIALSYLVIFSTQEPAGWRAGVCIALLLASNLALLRLPDAVFHHPAFHPVLVATRTALIPPPPCIS